MVCLLLSTLISYVNVKLNVFKFEEELFLDIRRLKMKPLSVIGPD